MSERKEGDILEPTEVVAIRAGNEKLWKARTHDGVVYLAEAVGEGMEIRFRLVKVLGKLGHREFLFGKDPVPAEAERDLLGTNLCPA